MAAAMDSPAAKPRTTQFTPRPPMVRRVLKAVCAGTALANSGSPQTARKTPSAPPQMESTRLSTRNCLTRRARVAPSAERMAISRWRRTAWLSSRFATLAQAMSSTKTTAAPKAARV